MKTLCQCINSDKPVVVFGAGSIGRLVVKYFTLQQRRVSAVVDNDSRKWGSRIQKIRVCAPQKAFDQYAEAVYIVANSTHGSEIKEQLINEGISEDFIIICDDEGWMQLQIKNIIPVKYEDKNFIFDIPQEIGAKNIISQIQSKIKALGYSLLMNHFYPHANRTAKYKVSICVIFKDEKAYLREWITYHKIVGIEHFYMYNNFSQDDFMPILQPFIDAGEVTLIDWPHEHGQLSAYCDCVRRFAKESRWIGFIDIDEFVVPIDHDCVYEFLKKYEKNRGSVLIYWKLFGSSGKMERDRTGLVTEDFTVSWRKHTNIGKCFYNTSYDFIPKLKKNTVFHHKMWTGFKGKALPPVNCFGKICVDGQNTACGNHFPIQINHYFTKSLAEYEDKKSKGDVYYRSNPHNDQYFLSHDMKCGAVDVAIYKYMVLLKRALS